MSDTLYNGRIWRMNDGARLTWSPFSELDFIQLPPEHGDIIDLSSDGEGLIIRTQYARFRLSGLSGPPETTWTVRLETKL